MLHDFSDLKRFPRADTLAECIIIVSRIAENQEIGLIVYGCDTESLSELICQ